MKKIILVATILIIFILGGCRSKENLKFSDIEGYWVDEHIYTNELGIDKVVKFTDSNKMIVYSYYDKGTTIYELKIKESYSNKIIFSIINNDEIIELEKISDNKFKYVVNDESLYLVKIDENEAEKFIKVIEGNSEY